jgi:hypothetical protein
VREPFTIPAQVRQAALIGVELLRRQHSGQTGDYVAWTSVGFALLGGLCALAT